MRGGGVGVELVSLLQKLDFNLSTDKKKATFLKKTCGRENSGKRGEDWERDTQVEDKETTNRSCNKNTSCPETKGPMGS